MNTDKENEDETFKIWKSYFGNNTRIYSSSNFKNTNGQKIDKVYFYLKKNNNELLENLKKNGKPLFFNLEQLILNKDFVFDEEIIVRTKFDYKKSDLFEDLFEEFNENEEEYKNVKILNESFVSLKFLENNNMIKNISCIKNDKIENIEITKIINVKKENNNIYLSFNKLNSLEINNDFNNLDDFITDNSNNYDVEEILNKIVNNRNDKINEELNYYKKIIKQEEFEEIPF